MMVEVVAMDGDKPSEGEMDPVASVETLDTKALDAKGLVWSKVKGHPYW